MVSTVVGKANAWPSEGAQEDNSQSAEWKIYIFIEYHEKMQYTIVRRVSGR